MGKSGIFTTMNVQEYAIECHRSTNHLYDGKPYEVHLQMVVGTAANFIRILPPEDWEDVMSACWAHDVIEDCRQTYNDVKAATNERVAELVYALTNEKGRNRKERANGKYYEGIRNTKHAAFIKICDRIANYEYSLRQKSSMADKYEKEMKEFIDELFHVQYKPMFDYIFNLRHQVGA